MYFLNAGTYLPNFTLSSQVGSNLHCPHSDNLKPQMHYFILAEGKKEQARFNKIMFMRNGTQVPLRMWWTTNHLYRSKFPLPSTLKNEMYFLVKQQC